MVSTALLVTALVVSQSEIETKYDKFRDMTSYYQLLGRSQNGEETQRLSIAAHHKGEERQATKDSDHIALFIYRRGPGWRYLEHHDVIMMEGRNRFAIDSTYDSKIDEGECTEHITIDMRTSEAKKGLESGKDWEVKIGFRDPIPIGSVTRKKIKEFLDYVQYSPSQEKKAESALAQSDIESTYDKFNDWTAYRMQLGNIEDDGGVHRFLINGYHDGQERKPFTDSDSVDLAIFRFGPHWRYLRDHEVIVMEGKNRFVIEGSYSSDVDDKNGRVKEVIHIHLSISEARKRLESDKDWEIKIGVKEPIPLGSRMRKKIKEFLDYLQKK